LGPENQAALLTGMKSEPTVSVALCTFNGAKFLAEQLQSLANQDRKIDELIICDDGSADGSIKLIKDFAAAAPMPLKFEVNEKRLGPSKNFQQAIERCTGEIIFLCDQDDRWHPNKITRVLERFENERMGLAFSDAQIIGDDGADAGREFWDSIWFDATEQSRVRGGDAVPVLLRHSIAAGSMLAFRADYLPLILPLPDLLRSHDIWITLLIAAVGRIFPIGEPLIDYRIHAENQIGVPEKGLAAQIAAARRQVQQNAFGLAAEVYQAIFDRLWANKTKWPVTDETLNLIHQKIEHSRVRHELPGWPSRIGVIGKEWKNGNYKKYSYGFKSVLQDLFLR
jgi:glycosyltransferase involved in cell wall biosynthesis